jgi:hypothetical protein
MAASSFSARGGPCEPLAEGGYRAKHSAGGKRHSAAKRRPRTLDLLVQHHGLTPCARVFHVCPACFAPQGTAPRATPPRSRRVEWELRTFVTVSQAGFCSVLDATQATLPSIPIAQQVVQAGADRKATSFLLLFAEDDQNAHEDVEKIEEQVLPGKLVSTPQHVVVYTEHLDLQIHNIIYI